MRQYLILFDENRHFFQDILLSITFVGSLLFYLIVAFATHYTSNFTAAYWSLLAFLWQIPLVRASTIRRFCPPPEEPSEWKLITNPEPEISIPRAYTVWYCICVAIAPFVGFCFCVVAMLTMIRMNILGAFMALFCGICCFLVSWKGYYYLKHGHYYSNTPQPPLSLFQTIFQYLKYTILTLAVLLLLFVTITASVHAVYLLIFDTVDPEGQVVMVHPTMLPPYKHQMHMLCQGEGYPTVLLFHGLGGQALDWSWIQPPLSLITKVCSYDRSGYAWSDTGSYPRTSLQIAIDLLSLLKETGLQHDQLILVGHSMAGFNMRVFYKLHSNNTLAIVCLDCVDTQHTNPIGYQYTSQPEALISLGQHMEPLGIVRILLSMGMSQAAIIKFLPDHVQWNYAQNILKPKYWETRCAEVISWPSSAQAALDSGSLGNMTFLVFSAGKGLNNVDLVNLSNNSKLIVFPNSDHYIPFYQNYANNVTENVVQLIHELRQKNNFSLY